MHFTKWEEFQWLNVMTLFDIEGSHMQNITIKLVVLATYDLFENNDLLMFLSDVLLTLHYAYDIITLIVD